MTVKTSTTSRDAAKPLLDDINKTIIKELQKDGRRSYVAIGKLVGLSEAAVRSRVQRLTDSGIIQIVAVTNPMQLGYHRQAMIGVTLSGALEPVVAKLKAINNIDYIVVTAGRYDLLLEVFCVSDTELLDLVNSIRKLSGVNRTEIFTYLQLASEHYNFGVL
ncbi:MAG: Lrp/AsnC family transcriptional regulator [Bifidobacterium sp.]|uniref:Lrp/AsnC family transcriptional regulator n=1 Tax=Bifidobacterium fermentum TaxID=3059035 RepID=A0AB39UD22_9BIFI